MNAPILQTDQTTLKFGGLTAVDRFDLKVEYGEIKALIGPNGSGKSSLLNMVCGIYAPSQGRVLFKGKDITRLPIHATTQLGIGRTFQNIRLFGELTTIENVMVAAHCRSHASLLSVAFRTRAMVAEEKAVKEKAERILETVGLDGMEAITARNLPHGKQRLLEIARALMTDPELLLLDEPTAGLSPLETQQAMGLVQDIRMKGLTILLVEHKMRFVMGVADQITVLNFGKKIAEGKPQQIRNNPEVIKAYLGTGVEQVE